METVLSVRACIIVLENEALVKALITCCMLILKLMNMLTFLERLDTDDLEKVVSSCPPVSKWKQTFLLCILP